MSQANVEIAQRAVDAYNKRDLHAIDDLFTSEFELSSILVEGAADFRGREGMETYFAEVRDTFSDVVLVAGQFRDLGERVLWLGRIEGHGRGSGVPVNAPQAIIYDFQGGKISRIRTFFHHGEALRAAGLSE